MNRVIKVFSFCLLVYLFTSEEGQAARIGDLVETDPWEQIKRFFSFSDRGLQLSLIGAVLFGAVCGLIGSFIVVRKMALFGDAVSHAVLPGVAIGFMWGMEKDPLAILIGATIAGLFGSVLVQAIVRSSRIKQDAALGIVLASFFALGLCLIRMIQNHEGASRISGLKSYLFGDVAVIDQNDLTMMAIVVVITVLLFFILYRPFLIISFDRQFAYSLGIPVRFLDALFQMFLAAAIVVSLQAVGVVLVSAMLIIPAATAYLLVDRMSRMIFLAMILGVLSAALGVFFSFLGSNLPTGPFMVISSSLLFLLTYLFSPKNGRLTEWFKFIGLKAKVRNENLLKLLYNYLEANSRVREGVEIKISDLASLKKATQTNVISGLKRLQKSGAVELIDGKVSLTKEGLELASKVVRNHRLWELYLTNEADYAADHVHDDAEKVEHLLSEEKVRELELFLDYPELDPHGKPIPGRVEG
ncbi:MAG: iron chelate uptake ABC transporter family permease subunit [Verrucomicrobiales bacterium]